MWKRQKRPYGAGFIRRGKTVDTIKQKHPLNLTRCADKLYSCFAISDGLLPTNLVGHVCSAQLSDRVDQLGISPGSHRRRRPGRKRPYRGGRRQQGRTIPVIVTNRSRSRTLHPLCTSTHDSVRLPTDKCSTAYGVSYSNLVKIQSLSPTDRGPGPFTLSALRLMILSDFPQISAVQHMGYLILTWLKLILVHLFKNFQSILKLCFSMLSQLETRHLTYVTI